MAYDLDTHGNAVVEQLLTPNECAELAALYDEPERFRSRIVMARYSFGRGEYQYFDYPLPQPVADLRTALSPACADRQPLERANAHQRPLS